MKNLVLCLAGSIVFLSCGTPNPDQNDPPEGPRFALTEGQSAWWIDKLSRKLRNGQGVQDSDELRSLQLMSPHQVIDQFMSDEAFVETVYNFNMYFLGMADERIQYPDLKNRTSFYYNHTRVPQAIHGARQIAADEKDYLSFLSHEASRYMVPHAPVIKYEDGEANILEGSDQKRREAYQTALTKLAAITVDSSLEEIDREPFCNSLKAVKSSLEYLNMYEFTGHVDGPYSSANCYEFDFVVTESDSDDVVIGPIEPPVIKVTPDQALSWLDTIRTGMETSWRRYEPLFYDNYAPKRVTDYVTQKDFYEQYAPDLSDSVQTESFNWFWGTHNNSSTNFNRKRAGYIFKTFLCDDLTPLNIVAPEAHAGDKHGSDPGCQSCHYKLDPMAGFFRYRGSFGSDYSFSDTIFFDDGAQANLKDYVNEWKDGNKWQVGYVRSLTQPELNDYTDNPDDPRMSDLFKLIQSSEETKRCLVQRMFEYFVSPEINVDAGYLKDLADKFIATAEDNSSAAFKETVQTLVTSNSFQNMNPEYQECYDFAPGTDLTNRAPCKIAAIAEEHCVSCHTGPGSGGGLQLDQWTSLADGFGFVHLDPQGDQVDRTTTFERILARLNTSNPDLKMPLNQHMPDGVRDILYLWATEELNR